ncbi:MAG TPA: aminotransferase class V-fold PLP-dependent enzyme, partial [Bacteroidia bacterium]|nr:aminotransferase class V-fold PLP-dependent enzyme [Bacteroidia bacterium]
EQDYGSMLDMFRQQSKRYGIVNKIISIPLHPKTDEEIVALYENAITVKTKLLMVCHMINITGQILPIKKICDMAHSKGVEVMVDGAHAVAHFNFKISELGCDYYGSSLHKWLGTPMGAGILYIRKEKIKTLWPIYGEFGFSETDVKKLNHTGTHPVSIDIAIHHAIDYHSKIGSKRKEERLRYLQTFWTSKVGDIKKVYLNTPTDPNRHCGIANVGIEGVKPADLAKILLEKHKIWTVAIDSANVHGVRVTPHVYTTTAELTVFIKALNEISGA